MDINVEKLSPVIMEFSVSVPAPKVKTEVDRAYAAVQKSAKVRGFRPGKAPRHVLAHLYGGRIHQDVAQRLVDETLQKALAEKEVQPLSKPAIATDELKPDGAFTYKARFEVRPEIEKVKWEGLVAKRPPMTVTDEQIDEQLKALQLQHATLQTPEPERAAKAGDVLSLSYTLKVDGEVLGSEDQEIQTEVGSGELFKEIDDGLVGMSAGEDKAIEIAFPDNHGNPKLKGKKGEFAVKVVEVKERVLPKLDDELAKDAGSDDLASLKKKLRDDAEKAQKQAATDRVAEQLVAALCRENPIPVPPSLVEQQARVTEQEFAQQARRRGQPFQFNDDLRRRIRIDAEIKVRAGLLMAEISKNEKIKVEDADVEKGYEELAEQTGKNVAKVKAEYRDPKRREMLFAMILEDKILDLIEQKAKITEGEPDAEPAEAADGGAKEDDASKEDAKKSEAKKGSAKKGESKKAESKE